MPFVVYGWIWRIKWWEHKSWKFSLFFYVFIGFLWKFNARYDSMDKRRVWISVKKRTRKMNKTKLDRNAESELHQCNVKAHYKNLKFWSQNLCSVAFGVDCIAHNIESVRAYLYIYTHTTNALSTDGMTAWQRIPPTTID